MKMENEDRKKLFRVVDKIRIAFVVLIVIYIIVGNIFNSFSFVIFSLFLIGYSVYTLITSIYFKKSGGAFGVQVSGRSAIIWGIIRFLVYFTIGLLMFFYFKNMQGV